MIKLNRNKPLSLSSFAQKAAREADTLCIIPSREEAFQRIDLTESKSAWLTIEWLSEELQAQAYEDYWTLFELHPADRGKVVVFGEEYPSSRWHRSYLNTPVWDASSKRSHMYSGKQMYKDLTLPTEFQKFLDFMNENEEGDQYNQIIANWYADGNDYIAAHSDCQVNMKPDAGIAILSLCEQEDHFRELRFSAKKLKNAENDAIYKNIKIATLHGCIITMYGDTQQKFRHKIPKALHNQESRISLTFRKF